MRKIPAAVLRMIAAAVLQTGRFDRRSALIFRTIVERSQFKNVKPQELQMARMLVETLAGDYDPDEFEDDYQTALEALVRAKLEGGEVKQVEREEPAGGEVVDLLAALQKSVDAARTARGEAPAEKTDTGKSAEKKAPAKKAASKKSTAKKAPAKKSAAKKTTKKAARKAS